MNADFDAIVEAVTREVLEALTGEAFAECLMCLGDCASHSSEKVRQVVAAGASRISYNGVGADVPTDLAGFIDHTLLKADADSADIDRMCDEAVWLYQNMLLGTKKDMDAVAAAIEKVQENAEKINKSI